MHPPHPQSHLFTVRLWVEGFGSGQDEVRLQVKHVLSGETRYFRDWSLLIIYLQVKLQALEDPLQDSPAGQLADSPED